MSLMSLVSQPHGGRRRGLIHSDDLDGSSRAAAVRPTRTTVRHWQISAARCAFTARSESSTVRSPVERDQLSHDLASLKIDRGAPPTRRVWPRFVAGLVVLAVLVVAGYSFGYRKLR